MHKSASMVVAALEDKMFYSSKPVYFQKEIPGESGNVTTKNLGGHSGCAIDKVESSDKKVSFVRKTSSCVEYNPRLAAQIEKQRRYRRRGIKTPRIIDVGYTESGLMYFDMEYVEGKQLSEYIKDNPVEDAIYIIDKLMAFKPEPKNSNDSESLIKNKLSSLKESLSRYDASSPCRMALSELENFNFELHSCGCHGDLTFENIIVTEKKDVYMIDFLDSFIDCYEIDISKLLQDAFCGWTYRFEKLNDETICKLRVIGSYIENAYKSKTNSESGSTLRAMLLFTLLRIYPYAKDKETVEFLDKNVLKILEGGLNCE